MPSPADDRRWMRDPTVLWRDVARGTVLLSESGEHTFLNSPSSALWRLLQQPREEGELLAVIAAHFDISLEVATDGLAPALDELVARGVVQPAPDAG